MMNEIRLGYLAAVTGALMILGTAGAQATAMINTSAVTSGGTLFDFEGFANLTNADNLFVAQGLTFQADAGPGNTNIRHAPRPDWTPLSGIAVLENPFTAPTDMSMLFATPKNAVEFYFSDLAPIADYIFTAYGAGNTVLESVTLTPAFLNANNRFAFVTFLRGAADIVRLGVASQTTLSFQTDFYGIDDLRLNGVTAQSAIPEPGALLVFGIGLAGLGFARRRRAAA